MKIIIRGSIVQIDECDLHLIQKYSWHVALSSSGKEYIRRTSVHVDGEQKTIRLHSDIMNTPNGSFIDHINGDTLDNRRCNLRVCTPEQNTQNRAKGRNNTSGYKGVCWHKTNRKWITKIHANGKSITLGYFVNIEDAYNAYKEAATRLHGEFAHF